MVYQRVHKSLSWNLPSQENSSQFAPRPFAAQAQEDYHSSPFQSGIENDAFNQSKEEHGTQTPVEQENLGGLQAKMNDFSEQRVTQAKAQPNVLDILIRNAQTTKIPKAQAPIQYNTIQTKRNATDDRPDLSVENHSNKTGMPDELKAGVENLSGYSLDNVRVHYNSPKPDQLQALAYTQGTEIHVAPGQEEHLPHEAWHVVQQMQGRVKPTTQVNGIVNANDDAILEQEAETFGLKALQRKTKEDTASVDQENNAVETNVTQNKSKKIEQSKQQLLAPNSKTVQRKITVGTTDYDAENAKSLIYKDIPQWDDTYSQILASFDTKDLKFGSKDELIKNLEYNVEHLEFYVEGAEKESQRLFGENGYILGQGSLLHDLVYKVIETAYNTKSAVKEMNYDNAAYKYTPETQLAYCLRTCINATEEVLALCLYTSYFYEPLNKFFRGQFQPDETTSFGQLVVKTAEVLTESYKSDTQISNNRYRLELKSGWIDDNAKSIDFKALTSTHPNLDGVKNMWGDVASGTFGDYDNFALLSFEGEIETKRPQKKYFENEVEDLMGPGASYKVTDSYTIEGDIRNIGIKKIRVFHLSNLPTPNKSQRITFQDVVP